MRGIPAPCSPVLLASSVLWSELRRRRRRRVLRFANIGGAAVINPDVIMRPRSNSITSQLHQLANLHELVGDQRERASRNAMQSRVAHERREIVYAPARSCPGFLGFCTLYM